MNKLVPIFIALLVILSGCTNEEAAPPEDAPTAQETPAAQETAAELPPAQEPAPIKAPAEEAPEEEAPQYTLTGSVNDANELVFETNLHLSKENYNKSHKEGEGHIHLYINSKLIGPLQDHEPKPISNYLKDGENTIKLALASNNHDESRYKTRYSFTVMYDGPAEDSAE